MRSTIFAFCVLAAWPLAVFGDSPGSLTELREEIFVLANGGDSPVTPADRDPVTVEAGQANGKGTIVIKPKSRCQAGSTCWSINFSAPTDKNSESTDFTNLDGLAKDLSAGFSMRWVKAPDLETAESVVKLCDAFRKDPRNQGEECDFETAERWVLNALEGLDAASTLLDLRRNGSDASRLVVQSGLADQQENDRIASLARLLEKTADWGRMWSLEAKVSHNEYEFFDNQADEAKSDEYGGSVMISWVKHLSSSFRFGLSAGIQRAFDASKVNAERCTPIEEPAGLETCKQLPLGAPIESEGGLARLEMRWVATPVILSVVASYDEARDVWGIELPTYFLKSSKAGYTGGFRVGWRSDEDRIVASVFVSKRLGF